MVMFPPPVKGTSEGALADFPPLSVISAMPEDMQENAAFRKMAARRTTRIEPLEFILLCCWEGNERMYNRE